METKDIKQFYENKLSTSDHTYEYDRWYKNSQARASYTATFRAVHKHALPLLKEGMSVFELGPGPGTWTKLLLTKAPEADYTLLDISSEMLKQAKEALSDYSNITYINSDILDYVPDKKFDFFFSSRIIEYVPDKKAAIKSISDSLKPGSYGYIATKTPQTKRPFGRKVSSKMHQDQISAQDLKIILEEMNCRVEKIVNVTSVFPGARSGVLDRILNILCGLLPFSLCRYVSESYAIVFQKNDN